MTKRTFWIVNQTAGSPHHGMVYRNYYVAREWVKQGHRAVIISGSYFHNFRQLPQTRGLFTHEVIDGIEYWWVWLPHYRESRSLGRFITLFIFPFLVLFFPFWRLPKPETVIVSGPPMVPILNAWLWARIYGATLVYEVRDIWPLTIQKLGRVSRWHPVILLLGFFERLAYQLADRVVSVLALAGTYFQTRGMLAAKFAYVPNGMSMEKVEDHPGDVSARVGEIAKESFTVVYAGSLGIANHMELFIQAARLMEGEGVHFVIIGSGPERLRLEAMASGMSRVTFISSVPKREIHSILRQAHVAYIGFRDSDLYEHGVSPNKIFDYMAAEKPILQVLTAADDKITSAGCGITVRKADPKQVAQAVRDLQALSVEEREAMGKRGRVFLEKFHTYPLLAADYVKIADEGRRPVEETARWAFSPFWVVFWGVMACGVLVHGLLPALWPGLFDDGIVIFLKDPRTYHQTAALLAQGPWGEFTFFPKGGFPAGVMAFVYKLTGVARPWMFLPVLAFFAGLSVRLIASCFHILGVKGRWWPLVLGATMTMSPTSMSWMMYPHKDTFLVPGCLMLLWTLLAVTLRRIRLRHFVSLVIGAGLVLVNKPYFADLFAIGLVLALPFAWVPKATLPGRIGRMLFFLIALAGFVGVALRFDGYRDDGMGASKATLLKSTHPKPISDEPRHIVTKKHWESMPVLGILDPVVKPLAYTRERFLAERGDSATSFHPEIHLKGTADTLAYAPRALKLVLLDPLPWRLPHEGGAKGLLFVGVQFEMLFTHAALLFLIIAFLQRGYRALMPVGYVCLAMALPFILALGYAVPNLGAINRYRFPFLIMIKLAGFAALWASERHRWPGRLLMWVDPPRQIRAKRRLLFLVPDDATFIIQRLVMARAAQLAGYDVHVACPDFGYAAKIRELGFTHHPIDLNRGGLNPFADAGAFLKLVFFLARLRPDLLHNVSIKPVIYGSTAGTIVGLPRIVNLVNGLGYAFEKRGTQGWIVHAVAMALYRNALALPGVRVIFQNPDDRAYFIEHRMVEESKTLLIRGSGVDMEKFRPSPLPSNPRPVVLFVGRLLWSKGIHELVEAARILRKEGVSFSLRIVGEPDERNPEAVPYSELERWHQEGILEWLGRQSDMPGFYQDADIICLPTNYREGLPLTLLEGASTGRPLVATDIPGCREVVRDGVNGFLVPPLSPKALAHALKRLLEDPALRASFGEASTRMVREEFSSEKVGQQLLLLYDSLFEDHTVPVLA